MPLKLFIQDKGHSFMLVSSEIAVIPNSLKVLTKDSENTGDSENNNNLCYLIFNLWLYLDFMITNQNIKLIQILEELQESSYSVYLSHCCRWKFTIKGQLHFPTWQKWPESRGFNGAKCKQVFSVDCCNISLGFMISKLKRNCTARGNSWENYNWDILCSVFLPELRFNKTRGHRQGERERFNRDIRGIFFTQSIVLNQNELP